MEGSLALQVDRDPSMLGGDDGNLELVHPVVGRIHRIKEQFDRIFAQLVTVPAASLPEPPPLPVVVVVAGGSLELDEHPDVTKAREVAAK